jgi:hypothetical protein
VANAKMNFWPVFWLSLAIFSPQHLAFADTGSVKLIEWGWNTPSTNYIREHIRDMEQLSFDGLVLDLEMKQDRGKSGSAALFSWNVWSSGVLDPSDYSAAIKALQDTEFRRFTDNFLRFNVTPGNVDWFDKDFSSVVANAALAAQIAKSSRLKGILLDVEHYQGRPFDYSYQSERNVHRFVDYQKQVEECGRSFIQAINKIFPDITILLTYGYHLAHLSGRSPQAEGYGLLPSFLDGIIRAASPDSLIIDGWEFSYGYRTEKQFETAHATIYEGITTRTELEEAALQRYRCSFGLWVDHGKFWSDSDIGKNYFTPDAFGNSLRLAIKHSDRYVWIYSEKANWWNGKMPGPYLDALSRSRSSNRP